MSSISLKNKFMGFLYAIYPHRGHNRYSFYKVDRNEKQRIIDKADNVVLSYLLAFNPLIIMTFVQYILSFKDNILIVLGRVPRKYK